MKKAAGESAACRADWRRDTDVIVSYELIPVEPFREPPAQSAPKANPSVSDS